MERLGSRRLALPAARWVSKEHTAGKQSRSSCRGDPLSGSGTSRAVCTVYMKLALVDDNLCLLRRRRSHPVIQEDGRELQHQRAACVRPIAARKALLFEEKEVRLFKLGSPASFFVRLIVDGKLLKEATARLGKGLGSGRRPGTPT